jgi:hypothetical protein
MHNSNKTSYCKFSIILNFWPRVSRVSLNSEEISELGFPQLIERDIQLTNVLLYFKGLLLEFISPTKPKSASLSLAIRFSSLVDKGFVKNLNL